MKLGGDLEGYSEDEEKIVYHYGKPGERLKNADEAVKRYYAGEGPQAPKGIFQSLVQTPSSRLILIVMLAMMAIVVLSSIMDRGGKAATVGLVPMELSSFSFEDTVSLNIFYNFSFKYSLFMHLIHLILTVKQINGPLVESLGTLI